MTTYELLPNWPSLSQKYTTFVTITFLSLSLSSFLLYYYLNHHYHYYLVKALCKATVLRLPQMVPRVTKTRTLLQGNIHNKKKEKNPGSIYTKIIFP